MIEGSFALAFTAGLVATVNPCGFAMLPAYLSFFLRAGREPDASSSLAVLGRGLRVGLVVSAGFLVVFVAAGVPLTLGIRSVVSVIPWATIAVGTGLVVLGILLLIGHDVTFGLPRLDRGGANRGDASMFVFGVSYAIASLSCTLPVFLTVVAGAIPRTNLASGVLLFVVYGSGMALTLMAITGLVAFGKSAFVTQLRRWSRHVNRVAGGILVVAGGYVVWFWVTNLNGPTSATGPAAFVESLSSRATELIGARPWQSAAAFAVVTAALLTATVWASHSDRREGGI